MNGGKKDIILLLTGTIQPNSKDVLAITDPGVRKQHYIEAISYYLAVTPYKIVFSENSGTSLAQYFPKSDRLEFLVFKSPVITPDKGKGWKELEIIEYSLNNSRLIGSESLIIKITGRLKVLNINKIVAPAIKIIFPNNKLVLSNIYRKLKMDSRCFLFTKEFWPYLRKHGEYINLSFSFEKALWQAVVEFKMDGKGIYKQFNQPLRINGISGGFGIPYKDGDLIMLAKQLRHFLNPIAYPEILK